MNVVLFGATGMVGQGVLRECLRDDGGLIQRIVVTGRSTYFCPVCQERLRRRPRRTKRPARRGRSRA